MLARRTVLIAITVGFMILTGACSRADDGATTTAAPTAAPTTSVLPTSTAPTTTTSTSTSTTAAPTTVAPTTAAVTTTSLPPGSTLPKGACATSQLSVTLGPEGAAAGSQYRPIVFTNTSQAQCTVTGVPGVSLVDAAQQQVGEPARTDRTAPADPVVLAPGAKGAALFRIENAGNVPGCKIAATTSVRVYPPGNTDPVFVPLATHVCTDPPGTTVESIGAVVAGETGLLPPG